VARFTSAEISRDTATRVGIDLGKHSLQLHGQDRKGPAVLRPKLNRKPQLEFFAKPHPRTTWRARSSPRPRGQGELRGRLSADDALRAAQDRRAADTLEAVPRARIAHARPYQDGHADHGFLLKFGISLPTGFDTTSAGNACTALDAADSASMAGKVAIIDRLICAFSVKAKNAGHAEPADGLRLIMQLPSFQGLRKISGWPGVHAPGLFVSSPRRASSPIPLVRPHRSNGRASFTAIDIAHHPLTLDLTKLSLRRSRSRIKGGRK